MLPPFGNALLAATGTAKDRTLFAYGAMLVARRVVERLHVVQVAPPDPLTVARDTTDVEASLGPELAALRTDGRLTSSVAAGEPLDALLRLALARQSDLILVGERRPRQGRRSLARRLAMNAPCSVWMVPDGAGPIIERMLAPVDFSARSAHALTLATAIAERLGSRRCTTVHVRFNSAAATYDEYDEILLSDAQQAFSIFVARIDLHGIDLSALFEEGADVAGTILRVAEEHAVDMIVMSTRGRSRAAAVLLGSETDHMMMVSPVPMLAVKRHGARLRLLQALLERRIRGREGPRFG